MSKESGYASSTGRSRYSAQRTSISTSNTTQTSSNARPVQIRPATAMGNTSPSSRQSSAPPPVPRAPWSQQPSPLSPHAPTFAPQRQSQSNGAMPPTPPTPTTGAYPQIAAQPTGFQLHGCCAIGYEVSNLSILTYLQSRNGEPVAATAPAQYEQFTRAASQSSGMPLMMVLPEHTNPLLCIMIFHDQPTDLFDLMHFPVPNNFLRIRQMHQVPVQGHLRKMYVPRARLLVADVMSGPGNLVWL